MSLPQNVLNVFNEVLDVAKAVDPNAPIIKAAEDILATIVNPSSEQVIADFQLALEMVEELKNKMNGQKPHMWQLVQWLFNLGNMPNA